jgi:hypothetical protein
MNANTFLRRLLLADAAISGVTGVLLLVATPMLARWLALPAALLRDAGFSLLPFAALVLYLAKRDILPRGGVLAVIAMNLAWVIGSVALLFLVTSNPLGSAFVIVQAIAVAALAEMQYAGLRRIAA